MGQAPTEVVILNLAFTVFWVLVVAAVLVIGKRKQGLREFRDRMVAQWRPSLVTAVLFAAGLGLPGNSILNPYAIAVFCQSLVGLALARSIGGFEPLQVTRSVIQRERVLYFTGLLISISLASAGMALLIGSVGLGIGQRVLGETNRTIEAGRMLPSNPWLAFALLLSGAGLAEETLYRLVFVSLFWRWTRSRRLAIVISALIFGAYHLTPLNGMYRVFWQFPVSQFLASTLIGVVWGVVFVRRGFETAVLGHTLSDWMPIVLFGVG